MKIKVTERDVLLLRALKHTLIRDCREKEFCNGCKWDGSWDCPIDPRYNLILTDNVIDSLKGVELDTPD